MLHHGSGGIRPGHMTQAGATLVSGTADAAKPVYTTDQIITALTTNDGTAPSVAWYPDIITYSINIGELSPSDSEYTSEMHGYVAMTPGMEAAAREAFELWDELIAVDLLEMDDWASAHITFDYSSNTGGSSYTSYSYWLVDNSPRSDDKMADADIWLADDWWTHDEDSDLYPGGYGITTYLHEIGHALGLTHPGPYNGSASYGTDATYEQDTRQYTVMSYFDAGADGSGTDHGGTNGWSYGATPLLDDILAIQAVYGADMTTRTGDTVYGFNSNAGHDAFDFTVNTDPVIAIWDAGGVDKIDVSGWSTNQVIDLRQGAFSSVGAMTNNLAIAYGAVIERAVGGAGDDVITGNGSDNVLWGGAGDDTIAGGDGTDVLFGGGGADHLDGGAGDDYIRFTDAPSRVIASLLDGIGTLGEAAGDTYASIEFISGSAYDDKLSGDSGHNRIWGGDGDDLIRGYGTNDFLLGEGGNDTIEGGTDNDVLRGGEGADHLDGGIGSDWAEYITGTAAVVVDLTLGVGSAGEAAGDTLVSIENLAGSAYGDWLIGDDGRNIFLGGDGDDTIEGRGGNDMLRGEAGADTLTGGAGDDTLVGGAGADALDGGEGKDWADYSDSTAAVDVSLTRGTGLGGDAAGDTLTGIEWLMGSAFDDVIQGDGGVNILRGGSGDDRIRGWAGSDYLSGNDGNDVFVFAAGHGIDRIYDFTPGADLLEFTGGTLGFDDLTINDFKGDASVSLGPGDAVLLLGIAPDLVAEDWFLFT